MPLTPRPARAEGVYLRLGDDGGGPRHFLAGRAVHCGDMLEMAVAGQWVPVRYEGKLCHAPAMFLRYAAPGANAGPQVMVQYPETTLLRWPTRCGVDSSRNGGCR